MARPKDPLYQANAHRGRPIPPTRPDIRCGRIFPPAFLEWLGREQPGRAEKVEGRLRAMRGGKLNDADFGARMTGSGPMARQIDGLFRVIARKHGLDAGLPPYDCTRSRRPGPSAGQLWLF